MGCCFFTLASSRKRTSCKHKSCMMRYRSAPISVKLRRSTLGSGRTVCIYHCICKEKLWFFRKEKPMPMLLWPKVRTYIVASPFREKIILSCSLLLYWSRTQLIQEDLGLYGQILVTSVIKRGRKWMIISWSQKKRMIISKERIGKRSSQQGLNKDRKLSKEIEFSDHETPN